MNISGDCSCTGWSEQRFQGMACWDCSRRCQYCRVVVGCEKGSASNYVLQSRYASNYEVYNSLARNCSNPGGKISGKENSSQDGCQDEEDEMAGFVGDDAEDSGDYVKYHRVASKMRSLSGRRGTYLLLSSPSRHPMTAG